MTKETQRIIKDYLSNRYTMKHLVNRAVISESELREAIGFSNRAGKEFTWIDLFAYLLCTDNNYSDSFLSEVIEQMRDEFIKMDFRTQKRHYNILMGIIKKKKLFPLFEAVIEGN